MRNASIWLTAAIALVFALQTANPSLTGWLVLVSAEAWQRPWTLLTAIFLHGSVVHLLYNALGLAMFGSILEQRIGTNRFLLVFFTAGLLSSVASTFFYHSVLGASGAIFGVLGATAVLMPKLTVWAYYVPMPMYLAVIAWAAADLLGFVVPSGVANAGHLAGLAVGLAAGFAIRGRKGFSFSFSGKSGRGIVTAEEFDAWERKNMRR